jgi:hypothetical protein
MWLRTLRAHAGTLYFWSEVGTFHGLLGASQLTGGERSGHSYRQLLLLVQLTACCSWMGELEARLFLAYSEALWVGSRGPWVVPVAYAGRYGNTKFVAGMSTKTGGNRE